jgi:hypothetical protein
MKESPAVGRHPARSAVQVPAVDAAGAVPAIVHFLVVLVTFLLRHVMSDKCIPIRVKLVHRIVEGIAVAVRPDAGLLYLEPVRLDKQPQLRVVIPGVEILQARVFVVTLADPALCLGQGLGGREPGGFLAPGVCSRFSTRTPPASNAARTDPGASGQAEFVTGAVSEFVVRMNDVDLQARLGDGLARLPEMLFLRLPELLPWSWRRSTLAKAA